LRGAVISNESLAANRNSSTVPPLFAVLLGGNEVSPTGEADAGDKDGRGSATVIIDGPKLCFGIVVEDIDTPILAHIHRGVAGVNGKPLRNGAASEFPHLEGGSKRRLRRFC
jgi:CHRD domain